MPHVYNKESESESVSKSEELFKVLYFTWIMTPIKGTPSQQLSPSVPNLFLQQDTQHLHRRSLLCLLGGCHCYQVSLHIPINPQRLLVTSTCDPHSVHWAEENKSFFLMVRVKECRKEMVSYVWKQREGQSGWTTERRRGSDVQRRWEERWESGCEGL